MFITIEGTDGSGKTTLVNRLKNHFQNYEDVIFTREPGGTPFGERIRELVLSMNDSHMSAVSEAYLFAAARAQHVSQVIEPALRDGKIVISDRFLDSAIAYQGGGREIGVDEVININKVAVDGVAPDITIFLDLSPAEGIRRITHNRVDEINRLDSENLDFYDRTKRAYDSLVSENRNRFKVIDATKSSEEIFNSALSIIEDYRLGR
ncbi:dTMP kinase [Weissella confusa]|uniref:Thymidylate kinase n=1 Tax=Weissella confusa TaxID=1583 RepID=A0AAJ2YW05_WEICO|nr:dTMP kinase [Weissella confusa]NBA11169.1 dTMP kinase [Weissella confusa]